MQIEVSQETFDVEVNDQLVAASYRTADVERVLLSLLDEAARLERERSARMVASHPATSASEAEGSSRSATGLQQQRFSANAKGPAPTAARTIVFLAAPPGAGKSTLAAVLERLAQSQPGMPRVQAVGMDGFHHTNAYLDIRLIAQTVSRCRFGASRALRRRLMSRGLRVRCMRRASRAIRCGGRRIAAWRMTWWRMVPSSARRL